MKLKINPSTFIMSEDKPLIFNQLGNTTTISHTFLNAFPTLFHPDFVNFNWAMMNNGGYFWFWLRDIHKRDHGEKIFAKNIVSALLMAQSFTHVQKMERATKLSLFRSSTIILKCSLAQFVLRKYPWNNVGTCRTKNSARLLQLCGCAAVACMISPKTS